jgi:hypothetical protein
MAHCLNLHVIGKYVETENKRGLGVGAFWGRFSQNLRKKRPLPPSCLSVRMEQLGCHAGGIFMKSDITGFIEKSVENIQFSLKSDKE